MHPASEANSFKILRAFSVPKRDDTPNEDRRDQSSDNRIVAVSDGASVSFDSAPWAQILCRRFINDPNVSRDWLRAAVVEYQSAYDRETMPWMQQGAFDRGSFATLLGVSLSNDLQLARIIAVGDSILALVDRRQVVRTIPYMQSDDFDRSPNLISTNPAENDFLDDEFISNAWHEINLSSYDEPFFLLMTDALGRWLIDRPDTERVSILLDIQNHETFFCFVERERADGRLKRDDTTLVVIG